MEIEHTFTSVTQKIEIYKAEGLEVENILIASMLEIKAILLIKPVFFSIKLQFGGSIHISFNITLIIFFRY